MPEVQKSAEVEEALNAAITRLHTIIKAGPADVAIEATYALSSFLATLGTLRNV